MTSQRRPGGGGGGGRRGGRPRYFPRRKVCTFCVDHIERIQYRDVDVLRRFLSEEAKMESRRKTGVCSRHQRKLASAIKRARFLAIMPQAPAHRRAS